MMDFICIKPHIFNQTISNQQVGLVIFEDLTDAKQENCTVYLRFP
jgi:hypothetical protein